MVSGGMTTIWGTVQSTAFRRMWKVLLLAVVTSMAAVSPVRAERELIADLSHHLVAITTDYSGAEVLLFGTIDGPGDVIVVVRGPAVDETVRHKGRWGPVWIDDESVNFVGVPAFYWVAASRPLAEISTPEVFARNQIGTETLELRVQTDAELDGQTRDRFRQAFLELKRSENLYNDEKTAGQPSGMDGGSTHTSRITILEDRLFRIPVVFPANAPVGAYAVEVYLFRDGEVVSAEITPLRLSKVGVGADVSDVARNRPLLYGVMSVLAALLVGWGAGMLFKRRS